MVLAQAPSAHTAKHHGMEFRKGRHSSTTASTRCIQHSAEFFLRLSGENPIYSNRLEGVSCDPLEECPPAVTDSLAMVATLGSGSRSGEAVDKPLRVLHGTLKDCSLHMLSFSRAQASSCSSLGSGLRVEPLSLPYFWVQSWKEGCTIPRREPQLFEPTGSTGQFALTEVPATSEV